MTVLPNNIRSLRPATSYTLPYRLLTFRSSGARLLIGAASLLLSSGAWSPTNAQAAPFATARLAPAATAKLAPKVRASLNSIALSANTLLPVIIQTDGTVPARVKSLTGKTAFAAFASRTGKTNRSLVTLGRGNFLAARLYPGDIVALASDSHTLHVSPDLPVQTCDLPTGYADYALEATGADFLQANHSLSGAGVTVAVVDTGIAPHADLSGSSASRIVGWTDLVQNIGHPYDDNGHGTHVAGLVGGNGATAASNGYNVGFTRMAPNARFVGVKALDANGGGSVSNVIAGIDWCVAHHAEFNIRVLNLSVGHTIGESYKTDPLCQACERAVSVGITVVVAAGNSGRSIPNDPASPTQYGSITSPGNDPHVITVGAMNTRGTFLRTDDTICTYSSRGPSAGDLVLKPDLVAPGNNMVSLAAAGSTLAAQAGGNLLNPALYGGTGSKSYLVLSGTSMAAPVVAGAAALLLEADPTLTPDTIKARLMLSATKTADMDYMSYGAGYLNVVGALALTQVSAQSAISPSLSRNVDGTVDVTNFGWGDNFPMHNANATNFGWGDNFPLQHPITASNFGWGDNGPVEKPKGIASESDCMTVQNFGWGDNFFVGRGVFGPQQLPANVGPTDPALWHGVIIPLNTPGQADSMSLLRQGD